MKKNAGFTLIEMVVAIAIAALVLSGVSAVILMGLNNNRLINQAVTVQNDSRVITQLLQTLTSRGTITGVKKLGEDYYIQGRDDEGEKTLLEYHYNSKTLENADGHVMMENITSFGAEVGKDGKILTLTVEADGETYERSIYCRTQTFEQLGGDETGSFTLQISEDEQIDLGVMTIQEVEETDEDPAPALPTDENRREFLKLLATQYGSDGTILGADGRQTYAQWYNANWDESTPWCAIFVSWAAYYANAVDLINEQPWTIVDGSIHNGFAWVPNGVSYFKNTSSKGSWYEKTDELGSLHVPDPGDYVFFNFNTADNDADHVGVVLFTYTEKGSTRVVTIEGNSNGHVSLREYPLNSTSIMGYGVLDWNTAWTPPGGGN